ncbi:hypothetical protein C4K16_3028 [Pseudomonas chlororaphis subsp. aurantiaca]|jgi:hypothetical protein|nr:hypothetical protein C4K17_3025 [Pseudomonas chlororaphis subsp. aurantiaca]AZD73388.1 hypothetical protein C4K16_3028 [Pseudomonas chlororaphis subsp. aurantiaca]
MRIRHFDSGSVSLPGFSPVLEKDRPAHDPRRVDRQSSTAESAKSAILSAN